VGRQVFAAVCEFLSDESDSVEVGAHREFFVFGLRFPGRGAALGQGLVVEAKGKHKVASDFACV
jgi:hypothetical protein